MTRARKELYMSYAATRLLYGGLQHNPPSRFLSEIDGEYQSASTTMSLSGTEDQSNLFAREEAVPTDSQEPYVVPELYEGNSVEHAVFGQGTVLEVEGDTAVIYFKGRGTKKLNTGFAGLKKL
jgi:DNA helicase-2/ATP-dependent DNA helicase PcrA